MILDGFAENAGMASSDGRETPVAQRRPLQHMPLRAAVELSPTKRRKQTHHEDIATPSPSSLKHAVSTRQREHGSQTPEPQRRLEGFPPAALAEILAHLRVREVVERAAPVARAWSKVANGKELWDILGPNVRLLERIVVLDTIVERRSKGKLLRGRQVGAESNMLVRITDLELTNAGKDDGVPTSFLRESALLSQLRHPNIVRFFASEVHGKQAITCSEFMHENLASWLKRLDFANRMMEIQAKFQQLLLGLSHMHHQGVMHRNLKPDNIFLNEHGVLKIGDFTTTRMLDVPVHAYTPEDPKERERSGREVRRLWYRAPELILRDDVYGPKVDIWSVGCLLAEAAIGKPLIPSDSEIDHIFRTFRLIGTPLPSLWPELIALKGFSPRFPVYASFDFVKVARAACCGSAVDEDALLAAAQPDRTSELQQLLATANALGPDGVFALSRMLVAPPQLRATVDDVLRTPFFATSEPERRGRGSIRAATALWLRGGAAPDAQELNAGSAEGAATDAADGASPPPLQSKLLSADVAWDVLRFMENRERAGSAVSSDSYNGICGHLPESYLAHRTRLLDVAIGLANQLGLNDGTLHLAVCLIDKRLSLEDGGVLDSAKERSIISACLKIADVFCEQSKEYYKQENVSEYTEAAGHGVTSQQILQCEKELLPTFGFDLRLPTVSWFLRCYLAYCNLQSIGRVWRTASFIADVALLDHELLTYTPSLRAQCVLVAAAFVAYAAQWKKVSEKQAAQPSTSSSNVAEERTRVVLPALDTWDQAVRDRVCRHHTAVEASMCLQALVHTLVVKRREWKNERLVAAEAKYGAFATSMACPESFPVAKLVRYIVSDSQRGLLPE